VNKVGIEVLIKERAGLEALITAMQDESEGGFVA